MEDDKKRFTLGLDDTLIFNEDKLADAFVNFCMNEFKEYPTRKAYVDDVKYGDTDSNIPNHAFRLSSIRRNQGSEWGWESKQVNIHSTYFHVSIDEDVDQLHVSHMEEKSKEFYKRFKTHEVDILKAGMILSKLHLHVVPGMKDDNVTSDLYYDDKNYDPVVCADIAAKLWKLSIQNPTDSVNPNVCRARKSKGGYIRKDLKRYIAVIISAVYKLHSMYPTFSILDICQMYVEYRKGGSSVEVSEYKIYLINDDTDIDLVQGTDFFSYAERQITDFLDESLNPSIEECMTDLD